MLNKLSFDTLGVAPVALSGITAVKGAGYDRQTAVNLRGGPVRPQSLRVVVTTGATTGTPDSFSVTAQLQHSDDDVDGNYVNVEDFDTDNLYHTAITAAGTTKAFPVDAGCLKKYTRIKLTPAFVGGSGPTVIAGATFHWGDCQDLPVA